MPIYDCGDPDCHECQGAFGPDRTTAIRRFEARERLYEQMEKAAREAPAAP